MSAETFEGEYRIDVDKTEYAMWQTGRWALFWIEKYGSIDGEHHKTWVIDQVARILMGTAIVITEARWTDHASEYRFRLASPSKIYSDWAQEVGDVDSGVAP